MHLVHCPCCDRVVDAEGRTIYPFGDGKMTQDRPVFTLHAIDVEDLDAEEFRLAFMCGECFHLLEGDNGPDMWTSRKAWEALNPVTHYENLPLSAEATQHYTDAGGHRCADWRPVSYLKHFRPYVSDEKVGG